MSKIMTVYFNEDDLLYKICISGHSAESYVGGKATGKFELNDDEIARIIKAGSVDEAFGVLEEERK